MVDIVTLVALLVIGGLFVYREICFKAERKEWNTERSKLLDRVQAGSFIEYKAQERADNRPPTVLSAEQKEIERIKRLPYA